MTWSLALTLAERMSMVATAAFILSRTAAFQRILSRQLTGRDRLLLVLACGGLGIAGTYAGISIHGALANSRVIGVMVAGLLGGPLIGFAAGLVAGVHRYLLGGFTAFSCALAAVAEGTLGGLVQHRYRRGTVSWPVALATGLAGEMLQMAIILLTARPFSEAWALVKIIALPMITVNSIGIAIFMVIVKTAAEQQERIAAGQAQQALRIATRTLPFLRRGLNQESAAETARIIYNAVKVAAVAITDQTQILAHLGMGADHHHPGNPILTEATRRAMDTGQLQLAQTRAEIGCHHAQCRLASAVIVPLKRRENVIGTLKLYHDRENSINAVDMELARGLAHLFSTQLELAELEHQAQLRSRAELKALQAQVHPHFLFNALNAIVSLVRLRPDTARELLIRLADFLRYSLKQDDGPITLEEELAHMDAYLAIEGVRFGDKLKVVRRIDPASLTCPVPPFTLQPVVENAIKHGLQPRPNGGQVEIVVEEQPREIKVTIRDNGVGIPGPELNRILEPGYGHGHGLGLSLVNERLKSIYGRDYAVQITSSPDRGTAVVMRFPKDAATEGVGANALHRRCG
ncbi:sensor histidine kinase [Desulfotomaculum copahuensis]|uniref:histidine kinase n=1 Tax=Desulfotomaculum copahuensis TaxID=1838280 RepID=A0A1B7LDW9_9FIRM|nr:sensor histidine kinase [Desulfotomaculum copahuensis]OAT81302.1 histidine kinase [Desulfotomaculum copahuensis]